MGLFDKEKDTLGRIERKEQTGVQDVYDEFKDFGIDLNSRADRKRPKANDAYDEASAYRNARRNKDADFAVAAARAQGRREAEAQYELERRREELRRGAMGTSRAAKSKKKKKSALRKLLRLILILIALILVFGFILLSKVKNDSLDTDKLGIVPVEGYRNILLLGVDTRDMDDTENARTDAIMIMSINENTSEVSLTSIYRDTYLRMGGTDDYDKITHAHFYGGPEMTIRSLNEAMDLDIEDYVLFNFQGVADAVDAVGGITVDVEEYEIEELNKYTIETAETIGRKDYNLVTEPGEQKLDGCQAVSYGRIRKGVGDDFKRTERMRTVMKLMLKEVKTMNPVKLTRFANAILPQCKSDIGKADMMQLALKLRSVDLSGSEGFPYNVATGERDGVSYVFSVDLASDVMQLHRDVFGDEDYVTSETVDTISYYASYY